MESILAKNHDRAISGCIILLYGTLLFWGFSLFRLGTLQLLLCMVLFFLEKDAFIGTVKEYRAELFLLAGILLFGVVFSPLPGKSFKGVYDFVRGVVLFFPVLVLSRRHPEKMARFFLPMLLVALLVYLLCGGWIYWQHLDGALYWSKGMALLFRHYNVYGTGTAQCAILLFAVFLFAQGRSTRFRGLLLLFCLIAGLLTVFSGSRGSVLALLVVAGVGIGLRLTRWRYLWFGAWGCLLGLFLLLISSGLLGQWLPSWNRGGSFTSGRLETYQKMISSVWSREPLCGFGINTFKHLSAGQAGDFTWILPHNVYIEAVFSLGLVGCLLLIALLLRLVCKASYQPLRPPLFQAGLLLVLFYLTRGLVDMKLFSHYFPAALAFGWGMSQGNSRPGGKVSS